ncbi:hypothetical protein [Alicyclobacillus fodiniaquatilis]|uniref:TrbL/VirB6 plasmid conjugal transfer protein n=1 Tax=Alicyclobacillus fodiniaquatilis TaxID=1661150 RepID=A0ABW4JQJ3_9BACL
MSTTVPADTVFSASTTTFPGWNNPDPSAYAWTLPNTTHWYNFGQNISQGVFSFVANTLLELIAWVLHIVIYVCSWFSDPSNITNPVVHAASGIFKSAYQNVFVKFLPVLIMFFVAYLAWKYVVAHHAKMLTGIVSMLLATGLVAFFFFDFGQVFDTVDSFGQLVTNTAASAVASTAGTNVGSEYDTLWQNYILFPWEYGQFGQFSGTLSNFDVNSTYINNGSFKYQPDPTTANPNPGEEVIPTKMDIGGTTEPANWVLLFLSTTNSQGRTDLENILTQNPNVFATGSPLSTGAVKAANPFEMIPFLVIELLLILVPVIFLIYVGFQLFVRELLFIVTIMMGIVTIPMAFIPEIGWRITFNWLREAVGHQVERLGNAIYAALLFLVASLITQSVTQSEFGMMEAFLVDAILFAAALIYRQKIFSIAVNPLSDSVRGVDQHQRMTMDEYMQQQHDREQREGRNRSHGEGSSRKLGKLAENFAHTEAHEEHHHSALPSSSRTTAAETYHVLGSDEQPQFTVGHHVQKTASGKSSHLADSFKDDTSYPKRQKFARDAKGFRAALGNAIKQHIDDVSNPGPPLSHEERIRRREQRARGIEVKLHRHSVKALRRTIMSVPKLASGFSNVPDDDPPPPAPPGGGPVADSGDKLRKMMVTSDGSGSQGVIFDLDGNKIAYDPPSIARPRRDEADINTPSLSEGFNVAAQDVPVSSSKEQPSQPISVNPPAPTERVTEVEQAGQATLATGFTLDVPQSEPVPAPDQARLSAEKPAPQNGSESGASTKPPEAPTTQNDTDAQPAPQNDPQPNSESVAVISQQTSLPVQTKPLPANVTRLQDERQHRTEVEGRQREQRSQRVRQQQGRRRAVRVNDRNPRPPRP